MLKYLSVFLIHLTLKVSSFKVRINLNIAGIYSLIVMFLCILQSCIEPYTPKEILDNGNILVVDGFLDVGSDTSFIYLSRTRRLSDEGAKFIVSGAEVSAVGEDGMEYTFQEKQNGTYFSNLKSLNREKKYKITIRLKDGKKYESEFVEVKVSPEIENIKYEIGSDGVKVLVSTFDAENKSKYYMWTFEDTWIVNPSYESFYRYDFGNLIERTEQIYTCWQSDQGKQYVLGTTENLSEDRISDNQIPLIPANSERLAVRFSRLLKQKVLTEEGFRYWQNVSKMNENMGSIFDPMPGEVNGNIKCIDDFSEKVVGFISAGTVKEKRIFINKTELPWHYSGHLIMKNSDNCQKDTIFTSDPYWEEEMKRVLSSGESIPLNYEQVQGERVLFYSDLRCADCRVKGTNIRPEFWQD